ncbi:MAG: ABC transporter ATP-binding protein [Planctomycetaceae bacterium]|nr:ABC transporter ATP-binding protein [Planctomycetaceae bacterium]
MPLIQVEELGKVYGNFTALDRCSLQIHAGEIFGLLGPNGAGKTTLMRCLLGFIRPTSGRARIGGFDCWTQRTQAHSLLTYMPAQPQLPRLMRARDVLRFFADVRPPMPSEAGRESTTTAIESTTSPATRRFERACQLADRLQLDLNRWVALMSTGMRQKLAIAATLCSDAPLVFLDEPTANLDPDVRSQLLQELDDLRRRGTTIVFSSHVLSEIEQICDRVAVLAKGRLVGLSEMHRLQQGSVITGKLPSNTKLEVPGERIDWTEPGRFKWQSYRPLEELLPSLLSLGVSELKIENLGLLDIYHQHLSYRPPDAAAFQLKDAGSGQ